MNMADDILGGVLTDPSKAPGATYEANSMEMPTEEKLPELSEGQHDVLMSHVLGEGKVGDTVKKVVKGAGRLARKAGKAIDDTRPSPELLKKAGHQDRDSYKAGKDVKPQPPRKVFKADKSGTVRSADRYGTTEKPPKPLNLKVNMQNMPKVPGGLRKEGPKPKTSIADAKPKPLSPVNKKKLIKHNVKMGMLKNESQQVKIPLGDRPDFKGRQEKRKTLPGPKGKTLPPRPPVTSNTRLPGMDKLKGGPKGRPPVTKNLTTEQLDVLQRAKDILGEMTGVGSLGVNMAGKTTSKKDSSYHRAMSVKLPGDKDQAAQIKAISTPPVYKAEAAKDPAPSGKRNKRVIVKRKTNQSKDDETQKRVHDDMKAMYHESFNSFVDGILLKEDASKGYPGDVSVAEFGRKGPSSDTFGGGGVRSKGRGPKIQLTKNQLMTAKKRVKGSDKDHETPGFGKASSHSRKHPQNPYAGGK
tara:strand:+ start:1170 stop:2579 length:1410 start_codon:yes stop_codon:yes gene_type:complete